MNKEQILALAEKCGIFPRLTPSGTDEVWSTKRDVESFFNAAIESYKAELLKEVGEPVYQVCKSDSISLSTAWIDVTEQTYNDSGLYPEYGRRILYTSDQLATAILKATKPLEDEVVKWREASRVKHIEAIDWAGKHQAISYELDELRAQLSAAQEVEASSKDSLRLLESVKYLRGIAEHGEERQQREDETVEQFVLGYVKKLEAQLAKAEQRVTEAVALSEDDIKQIRLSIPPICTHEEILKATATFCANKWRKLVKEV